MTWLRSKLQRNLNLKWQSVSQTGIFWWMRNWDSTSLSIAKERGNSSTTTSVPKAAPTWKCLQVQTTWTYFYLTLYLQDLKCVIALSPLTTLETARQERSMLLSGDKRLLKKGWCKDLLCNQKENYESLKLIFIRLECMCISPGAPKSCKWILTCLVCPIPSAYARMQSCVKVMMWLTCHLIFWWCGELITSDLTQWSGLITRVASDLSQTHQKHHFKVRCIIDLQHLPPQMKNQHGLNEEKNHIRKKNDLSFKSSEVTHVASLDTNNLSVRV